MADSPVTSAVGVVSYEITCNGSKLKDSYQVVSIQVRKQVNRIPSATIVLYDGDPADQTFTISDSNDLVPGAEVEIKAGYKGTNASIFKGIVVKHSLSINENMAPQLEIEVKDKALKMTVGRKNAYFKEKKDSEVIQALIGDAGLSADAKATDVKHPMLVQHYCSDWDFMLTRADINGHIVTVEAGKVTVGPPETSGSAVLTVTYGSDLMAFDGQLNSASQLSAVTGTIWDQSTQKIAQKNGSKPSLNDQGNLASTKLADVLGVSEFGLQTMGNILDTQLKAWADAQFQKSWMNKITGTAKFQGSDKPLPGTVIEFKGVGARFEGNAFISGVEHEIRDGYWYTTVTMGTSSEWFAERPNIDVPLASALIPATKGLTIGKVKKLEEDPDSEFRIFVTLPLMQDDSNGVWARLAGFYHTSGAGAFFIPEVGDEVVVDFLNGDPRFPVILGSLYSSKNKPGKDVDGTDYALADDNYTKAFLTKANNRIEFNDEDKIITVTTPGKNMVVMDDKEKSVTAKDQNGNSIVLDSDGILLKDKSGNKITMSSSGIEINSASSLTLKAAQAVSVSAGTNLDLKATSNLTLKGLQVSGTADTAMSMKGTASAEFSASGTCTVKGAMVMIN